MSDWTAALKDHRIASQEEWTRECAAFLAKEKEFTRRRDELNRLRRELPWVRVEKDYAFQTPSGKATLADLFGGQSQLALYHFMLGPGWEAGCPGCSFVMDHVDGAVAHLGARGISLVAVSRGPLAQIEAFKRRMGWSFPWVSSEGSEFNRDFCVSFAKEELAGKKPLYNFGTLPPYEEENPGISIFYKDAEGKIYHTYSAYARGLEPMIAAYAIIDWTPRGRDEAGTPNPMSWVRHHDKYDPSAAPRGCCH